MLTTSHKQTVDFVTSSLLLFHEPLFPDRFPLCVYDIHGATLQQAQLG